MPIKTTGKTILQQIHDLVAQLNESEYIEKLDLLSGNSIGRHVRHIMEFFDILIDGHKLGVINYDHRMHSTEYETNCQAALKKLYELIKGMETLPLGVEMILEVSYEEVGTQSVQLKSSIDRELAYNIEHAIHHMAIIKMAVKNMFPQIRLADDFGVAYSTIRYRKSMLRLS